MAKASANVVYNNFTGGLITEASPLNFPANAAQTIDNIVLSRDGRIKRRLGLDYETGYAVTDTSKTATTFDDHALSTFRWDNVGNDASISIGVIQIGNQLWFVDLFDTSPSATLLNSGAAFSLDATTVGTNISGNEIISFSPALGVLILVSKEMESPYYLTYDSTADSFTATKVDIKVRDIWGVDDSLDVTDRPSVLSDEHNYNLLNQGWTASSISAILADTSPAVYPSNADVVSLAKDGSGVIDADVLFKQFIGNTPAPKGKYVIDAFSRGAGRGSQSGVASLTADSEQGKLHVTAFYAGRIFYSGVNSNITASDSKSPEYSGYLFFSQNLGGKDNLGECYQVADPTSEHDSQLVSTDGGTIVIPEANNILRMDALESSLVVFAENGVWEVLGSEAGFAADDFQVSRVSNIGVVSGESVVNAEGSIFYWSKGGIYTLVSNEITGRLKAQNITETTIQTHYLDIPSVGKANATGFYDVASRQVRWLYNDSSSYTGVKLKHKYNRELILDLTLNAISTVTIGELSTNSPFVAGYLSTPNFLTVVDTQSVVVNAEQVQVNAEDVVITSQVRGRGTSSRKYLTIVPSATTYSFTLSNFNNTDFLDWEQADSTGVDAPAAVETGDTVFEDLMRSKQVTYFVAHFDRTENSFVDVAGNIEFDNPSGCLVQSRWAFADSGNSGKYGKQFQAYRFNRAFIAGGVGDTFDYGQAVITTKSKLRGRGKALRFRLDSEAGKDLQLIGWAINVTGNTTV